MHYIIKAIQGVNTFTTNALTEVFESPDAIEKDLLEKNYESLVLTFSKVIASTIEAECEELKKIQMKHRTIPKNPILEVSNELIEEFNNKEQVSTEENSELKLGQDYNLNSENFSKLNNSDSRPIFNNYTNKSIKYFDPFLQFGGESM